MKSSPKTALIVTMIIAAVILIIAALTSPGSDQVAVVAPVEQAPQNASLTLISPVGGTVQVGQVQHITWTSQNYNSNTVSINVLRKVSDAPVSYELIRTISAATANDGDAVWVPTKAEVGTNIIIEVACSFSNQGCQAIRSAASLAVVDTGHTSNTASVYSAIEAEENK